MSYILTEAGTALMKPTSFLLESTRTPQCHSDRQPGGHKALKQSQSECISLDFCQV